MRAEGAELGFGPLAEIRPSDVVGWDFAVEGRTSGMECSRVERVGDATPRAVFGLEPTAVFE